MDKIKQELQAVQEQIRKIDNSNLSYHQRFFALEPLLCKEAHLKSLLNKNV